MHILDVIEYDCVNYKKAAMFISLPYCTGKCWKEGGFSPEVCQNHKLMSAPIKDIDKQILVDKYIQNPLTHAVVFGGLEPMDSYNEVRDFIAYLRSTAKCSDPVVIYTGYKEEELACKVASLKDFSPIIIKFGRFVPNDTPHYDAVLGVQLASHNQYAKKI